MEIKARYLEESKLRFSDFFEHEDTKTGLAEFGPFGKSVSGLHPTDIKLGFIGTRKGISDALAWIELCKHPIESQNIKTIKQKGPTSILFDDDLNPSEEVRQRFEKILNRDFIGFSKGTNFASEFQTNERWNKALLTTELRAIEATENNLDSAKAFLDLIDDRLSILTATTPRPTIVVVILPTEIIDKISSINLGSNNSFNLRRALKARVMQQNDPVPIQIIQQSTLEGKSGMQEIATRAWNFCTAQYYKAEGVPWTPTSLESDTCYIGVSFYKVQDSESDFKMQSSLAQAFDYRGQGLILRGDEFDWDMSKGDRSPHLTTEQAQSLVKGVLQEYLNTRETLPSRVVVHKTSKFWGAEHAKYNELDGFIEGIQDMCPRCEVDLLALRQADIRLFREGLYPPLRATFATLGDVHLLYTMGFIPFLETSPSSYIPRPWEFLQHVGGSAPVDLARELLGLTKMNFNNCSFADGFPITLSFARKVGEIMKFVPPDGKVQASYKFYM